MKYLLQTLHIYTQPHGMWLDKTDKVLGGIIWTLFACCLVITLCWASPILEDPEWSPDVYCGCMFLLTVFYFYFALAYQSFLNYGFVPDEDLIDYMRHEVEEMESTNNSEQ